MTELLYFLPFHLSVHDRTVGILHGRERNGHVWRMVDDIDGHSDLSSYELSEQMAKQVQIAHLSQPFGCPHAVFSEVWEDWWQTKSGGPSKYE